MFIFKSDYEVLKSNYEYLERAVIKLRNEKIILEDKLEVSLKKLDTIKNLAS